MSDTANPAPRQQHGERGQDRDRLGDIVEKWWEECIRGSAIGRDVDMWNDAMKAKDELKKRLAGHRG